MTTNKKGSSVFLRLMCTAAVLYACILLWGLQLGRPSDSNAAARNLREYHSDMKNFAGLQSHALQSSRGATSMASTGQVGLVSTRKATVPAPPLCSRDEPPLDFTLGDIAYWREPACGNNKCFFRSRIAPDHLGYLIADGPMFKKLQKSWEIACSLSQNGNHKHIYTETPPAIIPVSNNTWFLERLRKAGMKEADVKRKYKDRTHLAVLQVRVMAPGSFAEVGCQLARQVRFITELHRVLGSNPNVTQRYVEEVDKVVDLLRHMPRLAHDFQIMVEADGSVTHFDLDRWESKDVPTEVLETCICNLKKEALLLNEHDAFVRKKVRNRRFKKLYEEHPEFFAEISECNKATPM